MILYFTPGGRLGNQFFQLAMLHSVARRGELCITTRMEELLRLVNPGLRILNIRAGLIYRLIDRVLLPLLLRPLCRRGVFMRLIEKDWTWRRSNGLLKRILWIEGYFQDGDLAGPHLRQKIRIRPKFLSAAAAELRSLPANARKVFVHIRRTDYLTYRVLNKKDTTLPSDYYWGLIRQAVALDHNSFFIFLTDDPEYVDREFAELGRKHVSRSGPEVDFATMTLCDDGILSNSSLSWWGAFFMAAPKKRYCPEYWLGWKSQMWYPPRIRPSFAAAISVRVDR
jgi:hypothetical protein